MRVSVVQAGSVVGIKKASKSGKKKKKKLCWNLENSLDFGNICQILHFLAGFCIFLAKNCWDLAGSPRTKLDLAGSPQI